MGGRCQAFFKGESHAPDEKLPHWASGKQLRQDEFLRQPRIQKPTALLTRKASGRACHGLLDIEPPLANHQSRVLVLLRLYANAREGGVKHFLEATGKVNGFLQVQCAAPIV